jgi:PAS domain S-box-containing protein
MQQPSLNRGSPISAPDHLASIEELRRSYDCLPLAVYVNDAPNSSIYINPAYRDLFGSDPSIWKPSLVDDDAKKEAEAKRLRLWARGEPYAVTGQVVTSTGSPRHASGQVIPVFDSAGKVVRAIGVIIDVTEEVEAIAALEERELQARALVANAADAMVGIDSAHRIQVWNEAAEDTFGYRSEEIIGQSLSRLLPASARPGHPSLIQAFTESDRDSDRMNDRAVKALLRDGTEISVEIGLSKVRLGHEQLAVATIRDVSRREKLQLQQDQLHARYKALIQHARDPIFIADKNGDIV